MKKASFKYWFAHWCAFNYTAIMLNVWKPRFLLHDWEKPWLKLFFNYKTVQKIHRRFSRHHFKENPVFSYDYLAMIVDWECSRLTKPGAQETALEYYENHVENTNRDCSELQKLINHVLIFNRNI